IRQSGMSEAQQTMKNLRAQFAAMTGGDLDKALASIGNECGLVFTLDQISTVDPQIPPFGFMLACKVRNDTVFDLVDSVMKSNRQVIRTNRTDLRMLTIPSGQRMSIARSGDYLFVASTDALIDASVAVKSGKRTGLKTSDEFRKLSQGLPDQGNSF